MRRRKKTMQSHPASNREGPLSNTQQEMELHRHEDNLFTVIESNRQPEVDDGFTLSFHKTPKPLPLDVPYKDLDIKTITGSEFTITWFISPDNFYIQTLSLMPEYEEMMNKIPKLHEHFEPITERIPKNGSVLVRYSDGCLYRATIEKTFDNGDYGVRFVDFGNKVILEAKDIMKLDERYITVPKMAIQCSLYGVEPKGNRWVMSTELETCFQASSYRCHFHKCDEDGIYAVSLWNDRESLADILVAKDLAVVKCEKDDEYKGFNIRPPINNDWMNN